MKVETDKSKASVAQGSDSPTIARLISPEQHDLGGFVVRRALPSAKQRMIGPWIFFDHIGPASFAAGTGVDVRPHPHINLATVTYLFEGEMYHRDSLGNSLPIMSGEINLMVAGKGIVHSERQRDEIKARHNRLHGLQLWLALPESDEEMNPIFHHYASAQIPAISVRAVEVKVLMGTAYGVTSPVKTYASTLYIEAHLKAGQRLELPDNVAERGIYVVSGSLNLDDTTIPANTMVVLKPGCQAEVSSVEEAHIALIGGETLSRRHIWWNFVSSRKERIEQAKQDWRSGRFAKIPGDEIEFIPLPDE